MKRLLIMAAGTGGHIYPGLAIAATMRAQGWEVSWLGTSHGMERDIVPGHGLEFDSMEFSGLRGKGPWHALRGAWQLLRSVAACRAVMARCRPDVVLGMGGYVTVPGGVAARMHGIPLVLMNADAALLLSNRILLPLARRVLFGFPAQAGFTSDKLRVTGNPVRAEILALEPPQQRLAQNSGPLRLLVLGGSLGAQALNRLLPQALARIPVENRPLVVHQSGRQHKDSLKQAYAEAGVEAQVMDFIDNVADYYGQTDLVLCRAGAITVSELAAAGVASILVPLVVSTTSHQRDNAAWMQRQGAALHLPQQEATPEKLAALLQSMTREQCRAMAQAAYENGRRDANGAIAHLLEQQTGPAAGTAGTE